MLMMTTLKKLEKMNCMNKATLQNRFNEFRDPESYTRVDASHPLNLYIGKDYQFRNTLLFISDKKPFVVSSTRIMDINVNKRGDDRWALTFSVLSNTYLDVFCCFCDDIIESSRKLNSQDEGTDFICERYLKWQQLLKKQGDRLLSKSEVKGLIGELFFLKTSLSDKYGLDNSIRAWVGAEYADQDFIFEDTWYEVKSTVSGSKSVSISPVSQLDVNRNGNLVIIYLDKTSEIDKNRLTLNNIVDEIENSINSLELKLQFKSKLVGMGYYYHIDYDKFNFKYTRLDSYIVDDCFPCLRRVHLPCSVSDASYELIIEQISQFKEV